MKLDEILSKLGNTKALDETDVMTRLETLEAAVAILMGEEEPPAEEVPAVEEEIPVPEEAKTAMSFTEYLSRNK